MPSSPPAARLLREGAGPTGLADGARVRVGLAPAVLAEVRRPEIDVAVWLREPPPWIGEEHAIDRSALARGAETPAEVNSTVVRDPAGVRLAHAGDVLMLKGSRHPDAGSHGAIHRSPRLRDGEARLVLIVTAGGTSP